MVSKYLYIELWHSAFQVAIRIVKSVSDAEHIAGDCIERLLDYHVPIVNPNAWIKRVAWNLSIEIIRHRKVVMDFQHTETRSAQCHIEPIDITISNESDHEAELKALLQEFLLNKPEFAHQLYLKIFTKHSNDEIASRIHIGKSASEKRYFRTMKLIKALVIHHQVDKYFIAASLADLLEKSQIQHSLPIKKQSNEHK